MKRLNYSTMLKIATIVLMVLTPVFVIADAKRLGYVPLNGAWFTWCIPALLEYELNHD